MATPTEEYMAKRREFQDAERAVRILAQKLNDIARTMVGGRGDGWKEVSIVPGRHLSEEESRATKEINASEWPTVQAFENVLFNYWSLKFDHEQAWRRIPLDQQCDYRDTKPEDAD